METGIILTGFVVALAFVLISIIKFDLHPFLALLFGGIIMGAIAGLDLLSIAEGLATGFGNTMAGIGILIILGIILGELLHQSGSMEEIANLFIRNLGKKRIPEAMNLTGYIISIPVFFDAAFVILVNLAKSLSRKAKIPFVTLVTALAVGLIITHGMVIPTPGPVAVADTMGANVGWFIFYGVIASLIGATVGGVLYGKYLGKTDEFKDNFAQDFEDDEEKVNVSIDGEKVENRPSGGLGIALILLPILLILIGTIFTMFLEEGSFSYTLAAFVGDKNIALLVGVVVAYFALRKYLDNSFNEIISESTTSAGSILAITGAGGAFGSIINMSGIGDVIVSSLDNVSGSSSGVVIILFAFLVSALLRMAQGSTTVALVTTSAIFAPVVASLTGVSGILVGLAICAGGAGFSLPNDSGFWVVSRFANFDVKQTIKAWTIPASIASITALGVVVLLSFFTSFLPGLL